MMEVTRFLCRSINSKKGLQHLPQFRKKKHFDYFQIIDLKMWSISNNLEDDSRHEKKSILKTFFFFQNIFIFLRKNDFYSV